MTAMYERLERSEREPKPLADHSAAWARLTPLVDVNGELRERIERFAESKQITLEALEALGARVRVKKGGAVELAFAGTNLEGAVVALKYRPLGSSHESYAEQPSTWLRPIIAGNRDSSAWLIAEGETDGARLVEFVGDQAAVMVLPAGALTFRPEWAALIPRGANVVLCHDADPDGDAGAQKAARIVGGTVRRVRPPLEGGDWCDWNGGRQEFVNLVRAAAAREAVEFVPVEEFVSSPVPQAEPIVVDANGSTALAADGFGLTYGDGGAGKTTLWIDASMHFATGEAWLEGLLAPTRPLKVGWVENEGPQEEFRRKLERKLEARRDQIPAGCFHVLNAPWGALDLRDAMHRAGLAAAVRDLELDLLILGPLNDLGMEGGGTPDEVRAFHTHLRNVQLQSGRLVALMLLHHENTAGRISGAWTGRPDLLVHVTAQGHGKTRVHWQKAKWSSSLHGTTNNLQWRDGEGFELAPEEAPRPERTWDDIADYVLKHGGAGWNEVAEAVSGTKQYLQRRRDNMLEEGVLVNAGTRSGFKLWHRDDPARPPLDTNGSEVRTAAEPPDSPPRGKGGFGSGSAVLLRSREPLSEPLPSEPLGPLEEPPA